MASLQFILLSLLLLLCLSLGSARNKDLLDPVKTLKSDEMHDQNGVTKPSCMPGVGGVGGGRSGGVGSGNGGSSSGGGGGGGSASGGGGAYGSGCGENGCNYPPVIPGPPQTGENPYCMPSCGVGGGCGGGVGGSNGGSCGGGGGSEGGGGGGGYGSGYGGNGNCNYPPVIPGPPQTCGNPYCMPGCGCSGGVGINNGGSGGGGGGGGGGYGSGCGGNGNCNYPPVIPEPPQVIGPICGGCNCPIAQPTFPFPCPYGCHPPPSYGCPNGNSKLTHEKENQDHYQPKTNEKENQDGEPIRSEEKKSKNGDGDKERQDGEANLTKKENQDTNVED